MENINTEKHKKMDFKSWSKLRKSTFIVGIIVLAICVLTSTLSWVNISINVNRMITKFDEENPGILVKMQKAHIAPSFLAYIWKETQTFTYISNYFLAISMILFGYFYHNKRILKTFFLSVVYISITFAIYWTLIFPKIFGSEYGSFRLALSTIVHAINPLIGIVILILNRKNITLDKKVMYMSNLGVIGYLLFAFGTFWIGLSYSQNYKNDVANKLNQYVDSDIVVYGFLNFIEPFFYRGGNIAIVITLDLLMIIIAVFVPIGLSYFWKVVLRIKIEKNNEKDSLLEAKSDEKIAENIN
ncbi:MAGa3780 family membrane protein [Mycoplasmopsis fermentans]|uniref:MAGa3780 family membrane protein n=2 Tax=Mycoplasmopsis fermentans TaxID=2115 RepID=UPI000F025DED|nr:hypothetical protein [Mycoplasmopsis fermentans]RMX35833.1 putative membrane protein [Mycoplasmopsis fermentans MF-I2]